MSDARSAGPRAQAARSSSPSDAKPNSNVNANANATSKELDRPQESRVDARMPIALRVEYRRLNSFFADYTKNISHGGTFIRTQKPLPLGTVFLFVLTIPKLSEPLHLKGEVTWIVDPADASDEKPAGMGIRFLYESAADRQAVAERVSDLARRELGEYVSDTILDPMPPSDSNRA